MNRAVTMVWWAAGLWVLSLFTYQLFDVGLNIVMLLPAVAARARAMVRAVTPQVIQVVT